MTQTQLCSYCNEIHECDSFCENCDCCEDCCEIVGNCIRCDICEQVSDYETSYRSENCKEIYCKECSAEVKQEEKNTKSKVNQ